VTIFRAPKASIPEIHIAPHRGRAARSSTALQNSQHLDEATPPPAMPDWSPVRRFGGYDAWADRERRTVINAATRQTASAYGRAQVGDVHGLHNTLGRARLRLLGCMRGRAIAQSADSGGHTARERGEPLARRTRAATSSPVLAGRTAIRQPPTCTSLRKTSICFVTSFVADVRCGSLSKQGVITVTPTPSSTMIRSSSSRRSARCPLFGFKTPVPYPFGVERTGYLVKDLDAAVHAARASGADVIVEPFNDPFGRDAVVQWPGRASTCSSTGIRRRRATPRCKRFPKIRVYVSTGTRRGLYPHASSFSPAAVWSATTRRRPASRSADPPMPTGRVRITSNVRQRRRPS